MVNGSVSKSNIDDDIIRELEETDWTVDPADEEDGDEHVAQTRGIEEERATVEKDEQPDDDLDFDLDELECVDEDADEEKRDRKESESSDTRRNVDKRVNSCKNDKIRIDSNRDRLKHSSRHHPYRIYEREDREKRGRFNKYPDMDRQRRINSPSPGRSKSRRDRDRRRKLEYLKKRGALREKEHDIPLEELELEEVDCCDDDDDSGDLICESTDTSLTSTHEPQNGAMIRSAFIALICTDPFWLAVEVVRFRHDDDMADASLDFPDLCEEIDVEAMRRAAANAQSCNASAEEVYAKTDPTTVMDSTTAVQKSRSDRRRHGGDRWRETIHGLCDVPAHMFKCIKQLIYLFRQSSPNATAKSSRRQKRRRTTKMVKGAEIIHKQTGTKLHGNRAVCDEKILTERKDDEILSAEGPLAHGWYNVDSEARESLIDNDVREFKSRSRSPLPRKTFISNETSPGISSGKVSISKSSSRFSFREKLDGGHNWHKTSLISKKHPSCSPVDRLEASLSDRRSVKTSQNFRAGDAAPPDSSTVRIPSLLDLKLQQPHSLSSLSPLKMCSLAKESSEDLKHVLITSSLPNQTKKDRIVYEEHLSPSTSKGEGILFVSKPQRSQYRLNFDISPPTREQLREYVVRLDKVDLSARSSGRSQDADQIWSKQRRRVMHEVTTKEHMDSERIYTRGRRAQSDLD
uniref:R3H domain-containing protein n=1 Tax=Heterorhabditis bacteriophora TaxID=37862 RepID=A0A1I7XG05_HETBA